MVIMQDGEARKIVIQVSETSSGNAYQLKRLMKITTTESRRMDFSRRLGGKPNHLSLK